MSCAYGYGVFVKVNGCPDRSLRLFLSAAIQRYIKKWYFSLAYFKNYDFVIVQFIIRLAFLLLKIPVFFIYFHIQNILLREVLCHLYSHFAQIRGNPLK